MKMTLKIFSIINIIIGALAIIGCFVDYDMDSGAGILAGVWIMATGIITLVYLNGEKK